VRTNIEIDDRLMDEAMRSAGTKTKRETVEEGRRTSDVDQNQEPNWHSEIPRKDQMGRPSGRIEKRPGMVIVDTTVWIDYFRGVGTPETRWLDAQMYRQRLGLTDLILCELLQGAKQNSEFSQIREEKSRAEMPLRTLRKLAARKDAFPDKEK
jgi:hypothetical protein